MRLREFNRLLKSAGEEGLEEFVKKHLLHGTPFVFKNREEDYFEFRNRIAQHLNIGFHEVFIVGSAKQGFSYVKRRDSFNYDSDIDVAIVSGSLFEQFSAIICDYEYARKTGKITLNSLEYNVYQRFLRYYARGWIRPDMNPDIVNKYPASSKITWENFFKSISFGKSEVGNYEVKAGIFKSYDYLMRYHREGALNYLKELELR